MAAIGHTFRLPHPSHPAEGHTDRVYTIKSRGSYLVSGSADKTIRVWNLDTQRLIRGPLRGHKSSVTSLQFDDSPQQDVIFSGSAKGCIIIWQFSTGNMLKKLVGVHKDAILSLAYDANILVTACRDRTIRLCNRFPVAKKDLPGYMCTTIDGEGAVAEFTHLATLDGHRNSVNSICLRGETLVSGSGDRTIAIWDLRTGLLTRKIETSTSGIADVESDGRVVVAGCIDSTCRVYHAYTGEEIACLKGHTDVVKSVLIVPSEIPGLLGSILTGSCDGTIRYWQYLGDAEWECRATLDCEGFTEDGSVSTSVRPAWVFDLQISSGRVIASGRGPLIKIWDLMRV